MLYDENYVINNKPRLVHQGKSWIRFVLDRLQLVGLENPTPDEDVYINRLRNAKSWIEKFFDAAKSGMTKRFYFLGGRPRKLPSAYVVEKDYINILQKFTKFLRANYSQYCIERKINKRPYLFLRKSISASLLDEIMRSFHLKYNKDGIPYLGNLSKEPLKKTNTAEKIVKLLVAEKHNIKIKVIVKLLKIAKKAKQPSL